MEEEIVDQHQRSEQVKPEDLLADWEEWQENLNKLKYKRREEKRVTNIKEDLSSNRKKLFNELSRLNSQGMKDTKGTTQDKFEIFSQYNQTEDEETDPQKMYHEQQNLSYFKENSKNFEELIAKISEYKNNYAAAELLIEKNMIKSPKCSKNCQDVDEEEERRENNDNPQLQLLEEGQKVKVELVADKRYSHNLAWKCNCCYNRMKLVSEGSVFSTFIGHCNNLSPPNFLKVNP